MIVTIFVTPSRCRMLWPTLARLAHNLATIRLMGEIIARGNKYMNLTPDALVTLTGVVVSLVFAYLPGLKDWFDGVDSKAKPLIMAGILFVCAAGKLAYDCQLDLECLELNWVNAFWTFVTALIVNQGTFTVAVKQFKA